MASVTRLPRPSLFRGVSVHNERVTELIVCMCVCVCVKALFFVLFACLRIISMQACTSDTVNTMMITTT